MDLALYAFNMTKHVEILVKENAKESKVPELHNLYFQTLIDLSLFSLTPTSSHPHPICLSFLPLTSLLAL